jgi:hypothetical protein
MEFSNISFVYLLFIMPLFVSLLVTSLLILTCYQAKEAKNRTKVVDIQIHHPEQIDKLKTELDEKYSSIPEEYLDPSTSNVFDRRRSSSGYFSSTSSRSRSRSNSQVAIDKMLRMLICPENLDQASTEPGKNNMEFEEALSMFTGTEPGKSLKKQGESRRISWPELEDKNVVGRQYDRSGRSLDVILESE